MEKGNGSVVLQIGRMYILYYTYYSLILVYMYMYVPQLYHYQLGALYVVVASLVLLGGSVGMTWKCSFNR